ncbi:DEAD/DEAH box helicase [uncultured Polaribacter sp.]|uniref:DEAD/DEAH box helicase n=1 Tax=uncultured Polaribacter sp. TaxID=174711 RepID=UPI00259B45DE|nr:DEAD/DEAH box helicase [uncultured Polaribacter sp.]
MNYQDFILSKTREVADFGFKPKNLNKNLFEFQKHIVKQSLKKGRYAVFADCGLGKTLMQLEIAYQCYKYTKKQSLILAPLAVIEQTINEGKKFNINVGNINTGKPVEITNYEQLKNIDTKKYDCICLDESSILKSFQGKIKKQLIDTFKNTNYRFCFTATPSPNDIMELGNHSEFLGQMNYKNMLSMYFINDMDTVQKWRLKGHAEKIFWKWVSDWSICATSPMDLGFNNEGYNLPKLNLIDHKLKSDKLDNGLLFNNLSVSSTNHNAELKRTFDIRMQKTIELSKGNEPVIVWVKHNEESKYLSSAIKGAKEVTGSMKDEQKKKLLLGFAKGEFRVLVTKPKIAQYGLNYQHCNTQVFPSLDFSFEGTYQAIRRSYRFGQKKQVNIHLITTDTMENVINAINRKQDQFKQMQNNLKQYSKKIKQ